MDFSLSEHAKHVISVREIDLHWIHLTLNTPELRENDPADKELERFYRRIPDRGNRVLRVIVNTNLAPWRIVSVFFDRRMKGRL